MNIAAARTFLAIIETGNFVSASRRLNVTQSTISVRIKGLEESLGKSLFERSKAGCELTPAGAQFHRYARAIVRAWEEARHQIAVPEAFSQTLSIGGQYSLWSRLLLHWLPQFQNAARDVAIRASVGMPQRLMRELAEGVLDIAVIYSPEHRPGLKVEELVEDTLILVTAASSDLLEENYVFVDWGEEFRVWHAAAHESLHNPGLSLDLGAIALTYLINEGKSGYLPKRIAAPQLAEGRLRRVEGAPEFRFPVFVVYQREFTSPVVMNLAVETLRRTAIELSLGVD